MVVAGRDVEPRELHDALRRLEILIGDTDSGVVVFAQYADTAGRAAAVRAVKSRLTLPVVEFSLADQQRDPIAFLLDVPARPRVCVFFYDVEEALPTVTGYLNTQREYFATIPHAVIFWVREYGLREIATRAPDFWAWRSGVFDLRVAERQRPPFIMLPVLPLPITYKDRADLERQVSLYRRLATDRTRRELWTQMQLLAAEGLHLLGDSAEAESFLLMGEIGAGEDGPRTLVAAARQLRGMLAWESGRAADAESLFTESLALLDELQDREPLATAYQLLGLAAQARDLFEQAEDWYRRGLIWTSEEGFWRIRAATYHQLGLLAQQRTRFDEAGGWYERALAAAGEAPLEREIAATTYQIATLLEEQGQGAEAAMWYGRALERAQRLGYTPVIEAAMAGVRRLDTA